MSYTEFYNGPVNYLINYELFKGNFDRYPAITINYSQEMSSYRWYFIKDLILENKLSIKYAIYTPDRSIIIYPKGDVGIEIKDFIIKSLRDKDMHTTQCPSIIYSERIPESE